MRLTEQQRDKLSDWFRECTYRTGDCYLPSLWLDELEVVVESILGEATRAEPISGTVEITERQAKQYARLVERVSGAVLLLTAARDRLIEGEDDLVAGINKWLADGVPNESEGRDG